MKNLIKISKQEIGNAEMNSVNAIEIHQYLGVKTKFTDWIKRAIKKYDFLENVDFMVILKNEKNLNGGRPSQDYIVTLDMAKELSMLENNAKGKETRKYFIAIEKEHFNAPSLHVDLTPVLELLAQQNVMMLKQTEMMIKLMEQMSRVQTRVEDVSQVQQNYIIIKQENRANFISPSQAETLTNTIESASTYLAKYHRLDVATAKRLMFGKFNSKFNIKKYTYLKATDFLKAKAYLESLRDKSRLETDVSYKDMVDEFIDLFAEEED